MQQSSDGPPTREQPTDHADLRVIGRDDMDNGGGEVVRFGRVCLLPRLRELLVDGQLCDLGSRAFELLTVLIEARGAVVAKDEIMSRLWPDTVVEEANLRVQMSNLRKVLGEDRDVIKTIPGRGYVFVGEVTRASAEPDAPARPGSETAPLPLAEVPAARQWRAGDPATSSDELAPPTVVVIDDDPEIREALHGLLRSVDLRVESFASVREYLDSPRPERPGCLILDVRLPGRSGLDFHDDLVKANVRLPVIFISGYADVPMSVRAMKAGAMEFLIKPVRHQDLLDAIQRAIEQDRVPAMS
jgi:DNA-binding response OmpR family regulator